MTEGQPDQDPELDLYTEHLDIYATKQGPWHPEHGDLEIRADWDFLPSGDAYVTRTVKAAGAYWTAWRPRGKNRPHRRKVGIWAPAETIRQAQESAEETAARRAKARVHGANSRERVEDKYRVELAAAIVAYLDFTPQHQKLAAQIAADVSEHAARVGSGRVGRTKTLSIGRRAELAARAWIRHRFTDYEVQLDRFYGDDFLLDELEYRHVKDAAQQSVDGFLERHRAANEE